MKGKRLTLASLALLAMATAANAGQVWLTDLAPNWEGGPFLANFNDGRASFQTFCLEKGETFNWGPGTKYYYEINTFAVHGTNTDTIRSPGRTEPGIGTVDDLSPKTAWLYQHFRDGDLWSLAGILTVDDDALKGLQQAIWWIEGENIARNSQALTLTSKVDAINPQSIGNVRVLNLYGGLLPNGSMNYNTAAQSQLILVPLPAAAWAGLGLLGALAAARARRRRGA